MQSVLPPVAESPSLDEQDASKSAASNKGIKRSFFITDLSVVQIRWTAKGPRLSTFVDQVITRSTPPRWRVAVQ